MTNLMIFYPILQLTTNEQALFDAPTERFFPHITIPSVVQVIDNDKLVNSSIAEVQFPKHNKTDIVSVDYLHCVDSPEVNILTKMLKEQQSERSN